MKKYSIVFAAIVFSGSFTEIDQAANAYAPGSGASFVETESEKGTSLSFTNASGQTEVASVGDALKPVHSESDNSFVGYELVPAKEVASWTEVVEATTAPAEATTSTEVATA